MKHNVKKIIPEQTKIVTEKITCDFCGSDILENIYEVNRVSIERINGYMYPEGGRGTKVEPDMCGLCFDTKLLPWISENTISEVYTEEWDL